MIWQPIDPTAGDMIRVRAGSIWHYGIYVSDAEVIQFGPNPALARGLLAQDVQVMSVDIDSFLLGGYLEVAVFDKKEQKTKRTNAQVIDYARSRLGQRGYNIIHNNCEHFASECVFTVGTCSQEQEARSFFKRLPILDVYVGELKDYSAVSPVYPPERNEQIQSCTNSHIQLQRYGVWKLLERALMRTFGLKIEDCSFERLPSGKWACDKCCFSLSHSHDALAVAISKSSVGVDIELIEEPKAKIAARLLSDSELHHYLSLNAQEQADYLIKCFTQKESMFKRSNDTVFNPKSLVADSTVKSRHVNIGGKEYWLSVANDDKAMLRFKK